MTPPFSQTWLPYIYQYAIGGFLFVIGLIVSLRAGSLNLTRPTHRKWAVVLVGGLIFYMGLHASLIWFALRN